ncbi:hypothetical protein PHLCEN_2v1470 [Hermanssonia centrifuga]|uniref:Uncharacterized protein n=1 Tax=Hermanssonia centrifuga TaxID=98765 RepID=A0A2R6RZY8_9APHY|nr:hypothetical protein PHLCEN_2v1470 [Hermanssonia centrifuga]
MDFRSHNIPTGHMERILKDLECVLFKQNRLKASNDAKTKTKASVAGASA